MTSFANAGSCWSIRTIVFSFLGQWIGELPLGRTS